MKTRQAIGDFLYILCVIYTVSVILHGQTTAQPFSLDGGCDVNGQLMTIVQNTFTRLEAKADKCGVCPSREDLSRLKDELNYDIHKNEAQILTLMTNIITKQNYTCATQDDLNRLRNELTSDMRILQFEQLKTKDELRQTKEDFEILNLKFLNQTSRLEQIENGLKKANENNIKTEIELNETKDELSNVKILLVNQSNQMAFLTRLVASFQRVAPDYPVIYEDGARWRLFWWFQASSTWPPSATDVLEDAYGNCLSNTTYCFSRLPFELREEYAEMLGKDSAGTIYRWTFNPSNNVAHAVWQAFHGHQEVQIKDGNTWNPKVVRGNAPGQTQDSFHYRTEHGVRSLQIDDDNCDCDTSLSIGHGMCGTGFNTGYGPENVFGVDLLYDQLYDSHCQTPSPQNGLFLYFKDDDDCANVKCPLGSYCSDGIYTHTCVPQ